ncbi:ATP-grasp domain-containing protein [Agrobacterium rosae]|uniref:ATP-grasp domain-containing protein n=1 Tax=Agrobacterium rosae TaxID=1972867 RepID=UPI003A804CB2
MLTCLLTNPVVNHNLLARYLISRGVECHAYIDMEQVTKLPATVKSRGRDFESDLFSEIYVHRDELPNPKTRPFQAVIPGGELGVECAENISAYYGLAGNDPTTVDFRRNKEAMQKCLAEAGLPHIRSAGINHGTDLVQIRGEIGEGPYILKPCDAAGGESLHYCPDFAALEAAVAAIEWGALNCTWKPNERYLVQEYVSGSEFVVDLVARNGEAVVAAITRYIRLSDLGSWSYPYLKRFMIMEDPTSSKFAPLIHLALECAKALGIRQGAAHMEFIDGPKGKFMVEIGARLHGSLAPKLFAQCYDNDLLTSLYDSYFDHSRKLKPGRLSRHGLQSFIIAEQGGILGEFDPSEEDRIKTSASFIDSSITFLAGEQFPPTIDAVNMPACGFFANENQARLLEDVWDFDRIFNRHFNGKPYTIGDLVAWLAPLDSPSTP